MTRTCPTCEVEMLPGRRRHKINLLQATQEEWIPGPRRSDPFFYSGGIGKALGVTTLACPMCGLLVSYIDPGDLRR